MSRRLDVKSLIKLVGEDKLRKELDQNTYTYVEIQDFSGERLYVDDGLKFNSEANPVEWLVFNSSKAFWMIYSAISRKIKVEPLANIILDTAEDYDIVMDESIEPDENDPQEEQVIVKYVLTVSGNPKKYGKSVPVEWAEELWRQIKKLKIRHFVRYLQQVRPAVDVIDNSGKTIFIDYLFGKDNRKMGESE